MNSKPLNKAQRIMDILKIDVKTYFSGPAKSYIDEKFFYAQHYLEMDEL